ncbi:MAG: hypothetical protein AAFW00_02820 [Bacteroidota bacterium]
MKGSIIQYLLLSQFYFLLLFTHAQGDNPKFVIGPTQESVFSDIMLAYLGTYEGNYITLHQENVGRASYIFSLQARDTQTLAITQTRKLESLRRLNYAHVSSTSEGIFIHFTTQEKRKKDPVYKVDFSQLSLVKEERPDKPFQRKKDFVPIPADVTIRFPSTTYKDQKESLFKGECILCGATSGEINYGDELPRFNMSFILTWPRLVTEDLKLYEIDIFNPRDKKPIIDIAKIEVTTTNLKDDSEEKFSLEVDEHYLYRPKIIRSSDNQLSLAGLYSLTDHNNWNTGIFFMTIDLTQKKIIHQVFHPFSRTLIRQFMSEESILNREKYLKKKELDPDAHLGIDDLIIQRVIVRENGDISLISEQYKEVVKTITEWKDDPFSDRSRMQTREETDYYAAHILVTTFSPVGDLRWQTVVKQKQRFEPDERRYAHFSLAFDGDDLHFVFNDRIENDTLAPDDVPKTYRPYGLADKIVSTYVRVDEKGAKTRKVLFKRKDALVDLNPGIFFQPSTKALVIFATIRPMGLLATRNRKTVLNRFVKIYLD